MLVFWGFLLISQNWYCPIVLPCFKPLFSGNYITGIRTCDLWISRKDTTALQGDRKYWYSLSFVAAILQRASTGPNKSGLLTIQGVSTCLYLCMDACGFQYAHVSIFPPCSTVGDLGLKSGTQGKASWRFFTSAWTLAGSNAYALCVSFHSITLSLSCPPFAILNSNHHPSLNQMTVRHRTKILRFEHQIKI